jgi:hypothetical protein
MGISFVVTRSAARSLSFALAQSNSLKSPRFETELSLWDPEHPLESAHGLPHTASQWRWIREKRFADIHK